MPCLALQDGFGPSSYHTDSILQHPAVWFPDYALCYLPPWMTGQYANQSTASTLFCLSCQWPWPRTDDRLYSRGHLLAPGSGSRLGLQDYLLSFQLSSAWIAPTHAGAWYEGNSATCHIILASNKDFRFLFTGQGSQGKTWYQDFALEVRCLVYCCLI